MKKIYAIILFASATFFFACRQDDRTTVIRVLMPGSVEDFAIFEEIIRTWDRNRPDIAVKMTHLPWGQYNNKILTEIAGGNPPDIIFNEVNNFIHYHQRGILEPLEGYLKTDPDFDISQFYPEILARFTRDGSLYVIPRDIAPMCVVYYNKDLFDAEGVPYPQDNWTTDDFLRTAKRLTRRDAKGLVQQYGYVGWPLWNWLYTFGGGIVDDSENPKRFILGSTGSREALRFFHDLLYVHRVSPLPGETDQSGSDLFQTGRTAMFSTGIWETPIFRKITAFDWDAAMFPKSPSGHRGFASGGSGYSMIKQSRNKQKAWEVIKALTCDEAQIKMAEAGLAQPSKMPLARSPHFFGHPGKPANKGFLDTAVKSVVFEPFLTDWMEINERHIQPNLDLYFRNQQTLEETLRKIEQGLKEGGFSLR